MPDGEAANWGSSPSSKMEATCEVTRAEKDPRRIARKYQLELCKKATEENVIVYLGTGCGKTHIAVLLMHELGHLIRKPQKKICVFLAPTVALVQQQAKVIEGSVDFKVGVYCGGTKRLKTHEEWEEELSTYEVFVMTPRVLLCSLSHCFIKMEHIALLIFDECHHAQVKSNHPYTEIMRVFYKADSPNQPRIFGMTASPIVGKGSSDSHGLPRYINSLESLLNAKVCSVEDKEDLESFVATPKVKVFHYDSVADTSSSYKNCFTKLATIRRQCLSTLNRKMENPQELHSIKKTLNKYHDNIVFCMEQLGFLGARQVCQILLNGEPEERTALTEADGDPTDGCLVDRFLFQAYETFSSDREDDNRPNDLFRMDILKEPFFSNKLLLLVSILSSFRLQETMKCIVFVNRIAIAQALTYILQNLALLTSWKCDYLVGVHSGNMGRTATKIILDKFRSGKLNLLVATKVGEEGLDIQTCCLVIRFDLPETVSSFIQSRGRARMAQSEYVFLVDRSNKKEVDLIESFSKDEGRMNVEIETRTSQEALTGLEERIYKVDSSGATITSGYSTSLLYQYCAKLPHDEYFDPTPKFTYVEDPCGIVCTVTLPANAPIHQVASRPQSSMEDAKKDSSLRTIETLHKLCVLSDFLLPPRQKANHEEVQTSPDSESNEDDSSRGELHESIIPDVLKQPWSHSDNRITLRSYYIDFCPDPADRAYKMFSLFVKTPLPREAERMEVELHLAHGRSVKTKLVPTGAVVFDADEIVWAQQFQEICLRVILDRLDFVPEFVALGEDNPTKPRSSTFYLLLPVVMDNSDGVLPVDWKTIKKCIDSPIFRNPSDSEEEKNQLVSEPIVLGNGIRSRSDVENSLVYCPYKDLLFFVTDVNYEKNGRSLYKTSSTVSHEEHLSITFGIQLQHPESPLLHVKPLANNHNLLHNRKHVDIDLHDLEEYFIDIPPELCHLKVVGFSKDIGSSLSLLPSLMHRLENLLVAIQLKDRLSTAFPEGSEVSAPRILEALTTERCQERFSLERLETLGDSFLKFVVSRHLFLQHDALDEGQLTQIRSDTVNNSNLYRLGVLSNLPVYIRDQAFEPSQFFVLGRPCSNICDDDTEKTIHKRQYKGPDPLKANEVNKCSKNHQWLQKKTIADVVEALIGAFLVDGGFKAASAFLKWITIEVDFEAAQVDQACISSTRFRTLQDLVEVPALEENLGYKFRHKGLLMQAFIHPSYSRHNGGCYQRLEFLGDAVLDFLITSYLYSAYPGLKPGQLTDLRTIYVNNKAFASVAVDRAFHEFMFADSGPLSRTIQAYVDFINKPSSERGYSEGLKCPKVLGDLVESAVGAILLDNGFDLHCIWRIMLSFLSTIMSTSSFEISVVRDLIELCQSHHLELDFPCTKKGLLFTIEATATGKGFLTSATSTNTNKRDATKSSAQTLLLKLKEKGYAPKSKSLEDILKSSEKREPKLIGYDETPIDVISPEAIGPEAMEDQPPLHSPHHWISSKPSGSSQNRIKRTEIQGHSSGSGYSGTGSETTTEPSNRPARSLLYEICAGNCWKPPLFECCIEEGPGHMKMFTFKVVVEVEEAPDMLLECFGEPRPSKKEAAEHAAEGALWYMRHEGYLQKGQLEPERSMVGRDQVAGFASRTIGDCC